MQERSEGAGGAFTPGPGAVPVPRPGADETAVLSTIGAANEQADRSGTSEQVGTATPSEQVGAATPSEQVGTGTPGSGDVTSTPLTVWSDADTATFRRRMFDAQAQFIDEPSRATATAEAIVADAVRTLSQALEQTLDLADWHHDGQPDTEQLRMAMRRYREYLDKVLAL